jgi:hypothetical protein
MVVLDDVSVGTVAEGCIGRIFTITEFVISALVDVEGDRPAPGYSGVT